MTDPKIDAARDFAKKFGAKQVVIVFIEKETFGYASYGETKALCNDAKKLGDALYDETYEYFSRGGLPSRITQETEMDVP